MSEGSHRFGTLMAGLAGALIAGAPLPAQQSDSVLVYPGASVRIVVPSIGSTPLLGKMASAGVRGTICLGVAVKLPGSNGAISLILLTGISRLDVDRRTNIDAAVLGLEEPTEQDWQVIDMDKLRALDRACAMHGKPASRPIPEPRSRGYLTHASQAR